MLRSFKIVLLALPPVVLEVTAAPVLAAMSAVNPTFAQPPQARPKNVLILVAANPCIRTYPGALLPP